MRILTSMFVFMVAFASVANADHRSHRAEIMKIKAQIAELQARLAELEQQGTAPDTEAASASLQAPVRSARQDYGYDNGCCYISASFARSACGGRVWFGSDSTNWNFDGQPCQLSADGRYWEFAVDVPESGLLCNFKGPTGYFPDHRHVGRPGVRPHGTDTGAWLALTRQGGKVAFQAP